MSSKGKIKVSVVSVLLASFVLVAFVSMENNHDAEPPRTKEIVVAYAEHEWWLTRWEDDQVECKLYVDHQGAPTKEEVSAQCGPEFKERWVDTESCSNLEQPSSCSGLYIQHIATKEREKVVQVELPLPEVWITIEDCELVNSAYRCEQLPKLKITAQEPLPNEYITKIAGILDGKSFQCNENVCVLPLQPTKPGGIELSFWALSSLGDGTEQYQARLRVVAYNTTDQEQSGAWLANIISERWRGTTTDSCAHLWDAFPPISGLPVWLSTPENVEELRSDLPYTYLAGRLIRAGVVDARDCPHGGLETNGYANPCGLEQARSAVTDWQNRFDTQILSVATEYKIPAHLLKNIFAQESQFWPGSFNTSSLVDEVGLGRLTSYGADTLLYWNADFFQQFCPLVLNESFCESGYAPLTDEHKRMLQGAVMQQTKVDCDNCAMGIDLSRANTNVELFAQVLKANCEQVDQIIYDARGQNPGMVSNYADLWRYTLANYHAGPGCLTQAVKQVPPGTPLTWEYIAPRIDIECPGASDYVRLISR